MGEKKKNDVQKASKQPPKDAEPKVEPKAGAVDEPKDVANAIFADGKKPEEKPKEPEGKPEDSEPESDDKPKAPKENKSER